MVKPFLRLILLVPISCLVWAGLWGQSLEAAIKVYTFDDGLSHRNVFEIAQDQRGLIWLATINGLNRFDGYEFVHYAGTHPAALPVEVVSNVMIGQKGQAWLGSPDHLLRFEPATNRHQLIRIKTGEQVARQAITPQKLSLGPDGKLWLTTFDEHTGQNALQYLEGSQLRLLKELPGAYTRRPLANWGGSLYVGAHEQWLWQLDAQGALIRKFSFPNAPGSLQAPRIVDLRAANDALWVLLNDGRLFYLPQGQKSFVLHPASELVQEGRNLQTLWIEPDGDIWMGGFGTLIYYDSWRKERTNYDAPIRQLVKNTCTYRQIFQDQSEAVWIASDFGAIKITLSDKLFTQYLSGGSEYCSNAYCSTRGITEDENGQIYISYYNSIHVVNPRTNEVKPLFPRNDYFNYPFGILYHKGALWTGNGVRVDLQSLQRDTLFHHPKVDMGAVVLGADGQLWFGYQHWLYRYQPDQNKLTTFSDQYGAWDTLAGAISFLYQAKQDDALWVATLNHGVYRLLPEQGRVAHYHAGADSPLRLAHNQVNAIHEDEKGRIWLATAQGLHLLDWQNHKLRRYTSKDGLPNDFLNGLLPEGDSCLWISTDNGLCRFSMNEKECTNFFTTDGLSSNEFNRISFFRSRDGRMYFGGLNGVNAFYPDRRYLARKEARVEAPLLFTHFTYLDGQIDSLQALEGDALNRTTPIMLSHRDRFFSFQFSLADFRQPGQNLYSYKLEGFDEEWSTPSTVHTARYTDIPPGDYTFRVRARAGREDWSRHELSFPLVIKQAYYRTWWFWTICGLLLAGALLGVARYRLYMSEKRRHQLEALVKKRTVELADEKHKSEALLLNILPAEIADELKRTGVARAKRHEQVTVLFSDFKGFSRISQQLEPEALVGEIDLCFRAFDEITERHGLEKIKTVGDAYLLVGGITGNAVQEAINVVKAALEIQEFMAGLAIEKQTNGQPYFEARIGIHSGPLVAGIVGIKKFAYDIWGNTVNIASRMESYGAVNKVNLSDATLAMVQSHFRCQAHDVFTEYDTQLQMYWVEEYLG